MLSQDDNENEGNTDTSSYGYGSTIDPSTLSPDQLLPNADADGDGVPNIDDPFPLDPTISSNGSGANSFLSRATPYLQSMLGQIGGVAQGVAMDALRQKLYMSMLKVGVGSNTPTCVIPQEGDVSNAIETDQVRLQGDKFENNSGYIKFIDEREYERKFDDHKIKGTWLFAGGAIILNPEDDKCVQVLTLKVEDGPCKEARNSCGIDACDGYHPLQNNPELKKGTVMRIALSGIPTYKDAEPASGIFLRKKYEKNYECNWDKQIRDTVDAVFVDPNTTNQQNTTNQANQNNSQQTTQSSYYK